MLLIGHENSFYSQVRKADFKNDPYAIDFGISISDNMVELSGRVLEAPKLQYGGRVGIVEFPKFRVRIRLVLTSQDTFFHASLFPIETQTLWIITAKIFDFPNRLK